MLLFAALACQPPDPAPGLPRAGFRVARSGELQAPSLDELSGLAPSRRSDHLWGIEDGGNEAALYAIATDGSALGKVLVDGAENTDWEDLSSFLLDGQPTLLVADVGDNEAAREHIALYLIPEPAPTEARIGVAGTIHLTWEDGPRDCESVAVSGNEVVLITKRDTPPRIYVAPLRVGEAVARFVGEVGHLPEPTPRDLSQPHGALCSQPTALDVDEELAALLTYKDLYIYKRKGSWAETFASAPTWQDIPQLRQGEAVGWGPDGSLYVTTEQRPAPLLKLQR